MTICPGLIYLKWDKMVHKEICLIRTRDQSLKYSHSKIHKKHRGRCRNINHKTISKTNKPGLNLSRITKINNRKVKVEDLSKIKKINTIK